MLVKKFGMAARPVLWDGDGGGNGGGGAAPPPADDKKFTQADVDKIIGERLKRAEDTAVSKLLDSLGVKSADDIKSAFEQLKKLDDAQKSELEKAAAAANDWKAKAEKAAAEADAALTRSNERLLKSAVLLEAQKANVDESEIASVWLALAGDKTLREKITQSDNGDFENVADAVKEILKAHPKWLKTQTQTQRTPGTPPARNQGRQGGGVNETRTPLVSSTEY